VGVHDSDTTDATLTRRGLYVIASGAQNLTGSLRSRSRRDTVCPRWAWPVESGESP